MNMPLDGILEDNNFVNIDDELNFNVVYEPTKFNKKKYVINENTGEYLGVVGNSFSCAPHPVFFKGIGEVIQENRTPHELKDATVISRTAHNNAWSMLDITLPNVTSTITTDKHETTIAERIIALHAVDGSSSNQVYFGSIDFFCTNGQIRGEHDKIRRKNTSNFCMDRFIDELKNAKQDFYAQSERLQHWARSPMPILVNVYDILKDIIGSDKKAMKMASLYSQEAYTRGSNVFSLYSAFTNYASYADERNGFNLRETGNDTKSESMWKREHEVAKWISNPKFKALVAA
tara:strand:+ start:577 stop:1446 length:870 start_codon:yes stop_codon:yes gene_type:complete